MKVQAKASIFTRENEIFDDKVAESLVDQDCDGWTVIKATKVSPQQIDLELEGKSMVMIYTKTSRRDNNEISDRMVTR